MHIIISIVLLIFLNRTFGDDSIRDVNLRIAYRVFDQITNNNITNLTITGQKIEDITPLKDLTNLLVLKLYKNKIKNINILSNMKKLIQIDLGRNLIEDIRVLRFLTNLQVVALHYNKITNIDSLQNLESLREIDLRGVPASVDTFQYWRFKDTLIIYDFNGICREIRSNEKSRWGMISGSLYRLW